jgi:hypothetical protein
MGTGQLTPCSVTRLGAGRPKKQGYILGKGRDSSLLHNVQIASWDHGSFRGGTEAGACSLPADHPSTSITMGKRAWSYTFTAPCIFMA